MTSLKPLDNGMPSSPVPFITPSGLVTLQHDLKARINSSPLSHTKTPFDNLHPFLLAFFWCIGLARLYPSVGDGGSAVHGRRLTV
ncbi:hypothetical protein L210DRAFT_3652876 [Boletus edulis BED1]|uniref:Uncharacterized protein n=1 Tax=Boletus edulis BED1 TaxID=1328754 RepID=A0AAD4G872_BOLED|nr:hypothetical protein L210DRAFT_3652876 [Boletus edulis BED1]